MSQHILISIPDEKLADNLENFLNDHELTVTHAENGRDCQLLIYKNHFDTLILDLNTKNHSGLEVLKYVRLNSPGLKIILTVESKNRLNDLNLDQKELRRLGVYDILIRPHSNEAVLSSIMSSLQYEGWKNISKNVKDHEEEIEELNDSNFTMINIENFYSRNTMIFDIYIKIKSGKYLKILHRGDHFDKERLLHYVKEKNLTHLYFKTSERTTYINFINTVLKRSLEKNSGSDEKKVKAAKGLVEKYIEEVYAKGLNQNLLNEGRAICDNLFVLVKNNQELNNLLAVYEECDQSKLSHLFHVSFIATIICKNLDWATKRTVEIIGLGSLFHDIGKLKLPEDIIKTPVSDLDKEQLSIYQTHPQIGAEMLQKYPIITEPVRQIVYQHHEYINGEGFPNGLSGVKIYPLAKVVALADEFANMVETSTSPPAKVLSLLIKNKEKIMRYDPLSVKALIKSFIREKQ